jgi:hypothetical protein
VATWPTCWEQTPYSATQLTFDLGTVAKGSDLSLTASARHFLTPQDWRVERLMVRLEERLFVVPYLRMKNGVSSREWS